MQNCRKDERRGREVLKESSDEEEASSKEEEVSVFKEAKWLGDP